MKEYDRTDGVVAIMNLCRDGVTIAESTLAQPETADLDVFYDYVNSILRPMIEQYVSADFILYRLRPKGE